MRGKQLKRNGARLLPPVPLLREVQKQIIESALHQLRGTTVQVDAHGSLKQQECVCGNHIMHVSCAKLDVAVDHSLLGSSFTRW